jgi:hypothetical protein
MTTPWKLLAGSAAGTSHEHRGEPCQDYVHTLLVEEGPAPALIVACADGAGSASHAGLGARLACLTFIRLASAALRDGFPISAIDSGCIRGWHEQIRGQLSLEACLRNLELRDFACTLLTAVVGDGAAVFSQIGDGAIVYREAGALKTAFWPQAGEYASTTFFLTGEDFAEKLAFLALGQRVDELALITDGLQPLALHYASRTVHAPFFDPMFETLRSSPPAEQLEGPFRQFLSSKPVNDRTDDDKSLVLATRHAPSDDGT